MTRTGFSQAHRKVMTGWRFLEWLRQSTWVKKQFMENAMDYCVNIMLTVSYDRPISFIHTHTHTHHKHTHTTHTHTPTHHTHTHTHHTHTHTLTHTTHTLTHTTHTYTSNDYFSYTRTHERTNARTHARGSCMHNQDGSVVALTMVGAGRSEVRFLLKNVQIVSGTHSASYAMGTGVLYW